MRISDCSSDVCSSDLCFKSAASAGYNETGAWPRPRLSHGRPAGATSATVAGMTFGRSFPAALRIPWGMFTHLDHSRLLRFAGMFTWAVVGLPLLHLTLPVEKGTDLVVASEVGGRDWRAWE